ncbi:hypothetical protein D3C73_878610 [compost metagenome]
MARERGARPRFAMRGKVSARRIQADFLAGQMALDQFGVVGFDVADRQVRLAARQVADLDRCRQHHTDVRMLGLHPPHGLHDEVASHGFRRRHAHHAGQAVIHPLHLPLQLVGRLLHALRRRKSQFPRRGGDVSTRRAQEQPRVQRRLQRGQAPARRCLVDLQERRRAAQRANPINSQEYSGVVPIHSAFPFHPSPQILMHFRITIKQLFGFFAARKGPKLHPSKSRHRHAP